MKTKIKWDSHHEPFSIFSIKDKLFTENLKKLVHGKEPNGQTVKPTQLIFISNEAEFCALQNNNDFFSNFSLVFELCIFLENAFLPEKLKFQITEFFQNSKIEKKSL